MPYVGAVLMLGEWVDFEYSVNGKMYQFSLPGGGFVSFTDLVEVLGINSDTYFAENASENESKANDKDTEAVSLTLDDVVVSEATRKFVANVENVEFSNPELVWVGKVDNDSTVGGLKEANELECQYSAELTEEQIAEINAQTVEAGDWALISMIPFMSEESLTITMKNGKQYVIQITDAQIQKNFIAASGETYRITVTYGPETEIPDNAELDVVEILPAETYRGDVGSNVSSMYGKTYEEYISYTENALGIDEGSAEYIRLFDIKLVDKDNHSIQYQPAEGSTVDVKIELADAQSDNLSVVHFADEGTEGTVVDNTTETRDDGQVVEFKADGFSVYAIVDAPALVEPEIKTVSNLEEFTDIQDLGTTGFYLSIKNPKQSYFSSKLNNAGCLIEEEDWNNSAVWYFEPVANQEGQYYIFTWVDGVKKYIKQTSANSNNSIKLDSSGTAFVMSDAGNGTFYIKHAGQDRWLQHSNGGGGIRFYTSNTSSPANCKITMTYASSVAVPDDCYNLDGQKWGIVYDSESLFCTALMSNAGETQGTLKGQDMVNLATKGHEDHLFVPLDSDLTEWTFHSDDQDYYYLTTMVDGIEFYLTISDGSASLSNTKTEGSRIRVVPGTGQHEGFYSFSADGAKLAMSGEEEHRSFAGAENDSGKCWMKLAEKSQLTEDDFLIYSAKKISVSDPADQVVLYTRVWNGSHYEFYAVDYDGSLIRCYDDGDVIKWVGNQYETAVFNLTNHNDYDSQGNILSERYGLQNTYTEQYIAPQLEGNKVFADRLVKLNLDGRYYQEDYTSIKCWDDTYYSYIGLKVDLENHRVVPCPPSQADDFYFARIKTSPVNLTEVKTVDNDDYGITMKMIDFNNTIVNDRDLLQTEYLGLNSNATGLLTTNLDEDGYPVATKNNKSLGELFSGTDENPLTEANHLFVQSVLDESGYFEYDSTKNYAYLQGNEFEVYDQLGTIERSGNRNTMRHGQFMPYNSLINPATGEPWPYSDMYHNTTDVTASPLPEDDPRYGEGLHEIPASTADYFFGMQMSAKFTQTADGKDDWGHDIIFEFSGDDDFWFYVDGELVLDLGGVHAASVGTVNFRTGEVITRVKDGSGNIVKNRTKTTTLYNIFRENYIARGLEPEMIQEELNKLFVKKGEYYVFSDYSVHDMKVFYMERGAGASNLHMRFNLTAVKPGEVTLSKEVTGSDDIDYDLMEFPYQIVYARSDDILPDGEYLNWNYLIQNQNDPAVTYQGSKRPVKFAQSYTPVGETDSYQNVFFLKPGETASINMPTDAVDYKIVECGVNMNIFKSVKANGETLSAEEDTGRHDYETVGASVEERPEVKYTNEVDPDSMRTLTITKVLWDENGFTIDNEGTDSGTRVGNQLIGYINDDAKFSYVVSMSAQDSSSLVPARNKNYYIKDPYKNYCKWDVDQQRFVSLNITEFSELNSYLSELPAEDKMFIAFETSTKGEIDKIPGGYSVEFRGLPVGSSFRVEEPDNTIPNGYKRIDYERDQGSYISEEEPNEGTIRANEDPHVLVHNQRGWGLTVNKIWSDADYMEIHDDIYFAVYLDEDLLQGSVRKLSSPAVSVYYYFDKLEEGKSFENYKIFEVRLTNPIMSQDGSISYTEIERIEGGKSLIVGGTPIDGTHQDNFVYEVSYAPGVSGGGIHNVREDTVTNTRRGIRLLKTDWNGAKLPGAVFTLKDIDGKAVGAESYTSGQDGEITIAYLDPGTYTLDETQHPSGFQTSQPWTIVKEADGKITVYGEEGSFEVTQETLTEMAVIRLKNKGFSLQAVKVEEKDTEQGESTEDTPLQGAEFKLYKQVSATSGLVRDQNPMTGYEALTTSTDGVIPKITSALSAGTYYLSEVTPPTGYQQLAGDLVFTVSEAGVVEIPSHVDSDDPASLVILNNLTDLNPAVTDWISSKKVSGHTTYTIRIPNELAGVPVRIVKVDQEGRPLEGATFTLAGDSLPEEVSCTSTKGIVTYGETTVEEALIYANETLLMGTYTLTETSSPDWYFAPEGPVTIEVENTATGIVVTAKINGEQTAFAKAERIDVNHPEYGWRVTVMNTSGYELPSTGGFGTNMIYFLGITLIGLAGAGYVMKRRRREAA